MREPLPHRYAFDVLCTGSAEDIANLARMNEWEQVADVRIQTGDHANVLVEMYGPLASAAAMLESYLAILWREDATRARISAKCDFFALCREHALAVRSLGLTAHGDPRHPLYLASTTPLEIIRSPS